MVSVSQFNTLSKFKMTKHLLKQVFSLPVYFVFFLYFSCKAWKLSDLCYHSLRSPHAAILAHILRHWKMRIIKGRAHKNRANKYVRLDDTVQIIKHVFSFDVDEIHLEIEFDGQVRTQ